MQWNFSLELYKRAPSPLLSICLLPLHASQRLMTSCRMEQIYRHHHLFLSYGFIFVTSCPGVFLNIQNDTQGILLLSFFFNSNRKKCISLLKYIINRRSAYRETNLHYSTVLSLMQIIFCFGSDPLKTSFIYHADMSSTLLP